MVASAHRIRSSRCAGEPAAGEEVPEAELGEEAWKGFVKRLGQVGQVVLDFGPVQRRLFGETFG
jgi:hypothetical protein